MARSGNPHEYDCRSTLRTVSSRGGIQTQGADQRGATGVLDRVGASSELAKYLTNTGPGETGWLVSLGPSRVSKALQTYRQTVCAKQLGAANRGR